jgi:hypothetical protein
MHPVSYCLQIKTIICILGVPEVMDLEVALLYKDPSRAYISDGPNEALPKGAWDLLGGQASRGEEVSWRRRQ